MLQAHVDYTIGRFVVIPQACRGSNNAALSTVQRHGRSIHTEYSRCHCARKVQFRYYCSPAMESFWNRSTVMPSMCPDSGIGTVGIGTGGTGDWKWSFATGFVWYGCWRLGAVVRRVTGSSIDLELKCDLDGGKALRWNHKSIDRIVSRTFDGGRYARRFGSRLAT